MRGETQCCTSKLISDGPRNEFTRSDIFVLRRTLDESPLLDAPCASRYLSWTWSPRVQRTESTDLHTGTSLRNQPYHSQHSQPSA